MKKLFTLLFALLLIYTSQAQRFKDKVFANVSVDSVVYGNAKKFDNVSTDMKMYIYQPVGDTMTKRPLIVLAHGGSFIAGSPYAPDVVYLCTEFAKRGYVCVSLQYRLGVDFNEVILGNGGFQFANAVWRGALDGRGAVRYLRANLSTYKINTGQVYLGGVSAGGVLGLHEAFLDLPSEVASAEFQIDTASIGGIEGSSGSPGFSWRVKGVISLCGALGNVNWMSNNKNVSIFSVHGTNDQTVPYKTDFFRVSGAAIAKLSGSFTVDSMAKVLGMKSVFYTFKDAPHVPFSPGVGTTQSSTAYMDTTEGLLRDFLFEDIKTPGVGINKVLSVKEVKLYPNPATNMLTIELGDNTVQHIQIADLSGKVLTEVNTNKQINTIDVSGLKAGVYFVSIQNDNDHLTRKLIIE